MESNVRVVRSRYTGDPNVEANCTKRGNIIPLKAVVNQEGERAVDTAQINISKTEDIN